MGLFFLGTGENAFQRQVSAVFAVPKRLFFSAVQRHSNVTESHAATQQRNRELRSGQPGALLALCADSGKMLIHIYVYTYNIAPLRRKRQSGEPKPAAVTRKGYSIFYKTRKGYSCSLHTFECIIIISDKKEFVNCFILAL